MLDGAPTGSDNEAGTVLSSSEDYGSTSVSIKKTALIPERWVKIAVCAVSSTNNYSAWDNLYVYLESSTLATPTITSHDDRETVYLNELGDTMKITWTDVSAADSFWYSVKLLDGAPESSDNEAGVVIAENKSTTNNSVSIDTDDLVVGKWLKIWVQAKAGTGYKASDDCVYVYIDAASVGNVKFDGYVNKSLTSIDVSEIGSGLTIRWSADNAVSYTYKAILMKNAPTGAFDEAATAVKTLASGTQKAGITSITIPKSSLTAGYYVKLAVHAYGADGSESDWPWIGFKITNNQKVGNVSFTGYANKSLTEVDLANLSSGLTVKWSADNAVSYTYKAILMKTAPTGAANEADTAVKTLASGTQKAGVTSITIPKSSLTAGYYVKLAVHAYGADGSESDWPWIGFKITNNQKVGNVSFNGYTNKSLTEVDLANLSSGLTVKWSAPNAVSYTYKAILMKTAPTGAANEADTAVKTLASGIQKAGVTSITIPKSSLTAGYYVKLAVHAYGADGSESDWPWIGFKITNNQKVGNVSFNGFANKSLTEIDVSELGSGLKVSWSANNAVSYTYKAILMKTAPTGAANEAATAVKTLKSGTQKEGITSITIDSSELKAGYYVKLAVHAYGADGSESDWPWIGFKIVSMDSVGKVAFSGYNEGAVTDVDVSELGNGLKVSWRATNAKSYTYKAILMKNKPTGASNEAATAVRTLKSGVQKDGVTSITIPLSDLPAGYYVKVAVHAYGADGSESANWPWIGFRITDKSKASTVAFEKYNASSVADVKLSSLTNGLTVSWNAENAVKYSYKAILMSTAPTGASNESANALAVLGSETGNVTSLTIPQNKLKEGCYVKVAVAAFGLNGKDSGWIWIGFKLSDDNVSSQIAANQNAIVSHAKSWLNTSFTAAGVPYYAHGMYPTYVEANSTYTYHGMPYVCGGYRDVDGNGVYNSTVDTIYFSPNNRMTLSAYKGLSTEKRQMASTYYYYYNGGWRRSAQYGTECVGFVLQCWRQVDSSISTSGNLTSGTSGKAYRHALTKEFYTSLQPGDVIANSGHVMLVIANSGTSITVIEQTAASGNFVKCQCSKCTNNTNMKSLGTRQYTYSYTGNTLPKYNWVYRLDDCMNEADISSWQQY